MVFSITLTTLPEPSLSVAVTESVVIPPSSGATVTAAVFAGLTVATAVLLLVQLYSTVPV